MRLTGRRYYTPSPPKMPPGLVEIMEGLTREVLKHNPSDIYSFCANHMEQLLEKRDGPSRKKSLSLDEKVSRAQIKVRQKSEIRIQEYDKNILLNKQNSNDVNSEITLHVPVLVTPQEPHAASDNDAILLKDQHIESIAKAQILHELVLDKSSEIEISHGTGPSIATPTENSSKSDCISEIDLKTNNELNDQKNIISEVAGDVSMTCANETEENENQDDTSANITTDIENTNNGVVNLEINKATDDIPSDILSETSIVINKLHEKGNNNVLTQSVDIDTIQDAPQIDEVTINLDSEEISKDENVKEDEVAVAYENESAIKIIVEDHAQITSEKETTDVVQRSDDISDIHGSNNTEDVRNGITQNLDTVDVQDDNTEKNPNQIELIQNTDQTKEDHADNIQLSTSTHTENLEQSNNTADNTQQENKSDVTPELKSNKVDSQTKYDEIKLTNNTSATEPSPSNSDDAGINQENIEENHTINSIDIEEKNDQISTPLLETETHFDVPTGIDSDIQTLVTEENISSETIHSHNEEIDTSADIISHIENEEVNLNNVTVKSDEHYIEDNSPDTVENFSSEADNDIANKKIIDTNENNQNDGSNMDLETAAVTIQKVFRTFLFKSRGSTFEDTGNDEANYLDEDDKNKEECDFSMASALNIDRRAHGITRMDTVLQTVNEEKSLSLSDDSSTLSSAATIIQAHVRGFLVRNRLNSNKTVSTNSLAASNSNEPSITSLEADNDQNKNKTVLNIHIGGDNYLSRDESLITSMELSLDSSPPSSINLHPLGYNKSERRKQLKREDAIQSISPPSNNSGKMSEDFDSVKELSLNDHDIGEHIVGDNNYTKDDLENAMQMTIENGSVETVTQPKKEVADNIKNMYDNSQSHLGQKRLSFIKMNSDEMDVVTPFIKNEKSVIIHSGEFHDAVLPTRVSRSDTSVVSEFKNVLVYFLLWNHT